MKRYGLSLLCALAAGAWSGCGDDDGGMPDAGEDAGRDAMMPMDAGYPTVGEMVRVTIAPES